MYEIFSTYLAASTWHSGHQLDDARFYEALASIVQEPLFNADDMGDYFRQAKSVDPTDPRHAIYNQAIEDRVSQAHAVHDFLEANSIII